ncbi:hypothetical protein PNI0002_00519 [Streptococcus pneumoniae PNI0002]|nr:hypothetical protein PNI0002_00519 [Streptococcus pneumoniae PNI0002]
MNYWMLLLSSHHYLLKYPLNFMFHMQLEEKEIIELLLYR